MNIKRYKYIKSTKAKTRKRTTLITYLAANSISNINKKLCQIEEHLSDVIFY